MRLVKGNKEFLQWWNHWMSRIHGTPGVNHKTPSVGGNVPSPAELPRTVTDEKSNRPKSQGGRRTPLET
jgi:hypothetical protein